MGVFALLIIAVLAMTFFSFKSADAHGSHPQGETSGLCAEYHDWHEGATLPVQVGNDKSGGTITRHTPCIPKPTPTPSVAVGLTPEPSKDWIGYGGYGYQMYVIESGGYATSFVPPTAVNQRTGEMATFNSIKVRDGFIERMNSPPSN